MALLIRAAQNNLPTAASPFYALASWPEVVDYDAFIERMASGRTSFSKTDIIGVFQLAREELTKLLAEGCYVTTPFGAALPVASGKLESVNEPFRPKSEHSGHRVRFDFRIDEVISKNALSALRCRRIAGEDRASPRIDCVTSLQGNAESEAAPGEFIRLGGARLKFDPADEAAGLFVRTKAGTETRLACYAHILPALVIAQLPGDLPSGSYRLILRSRTRRGRKIEGESKKPLRVP